jgi:hypothetical protein
LKYNNLRVGGSLGESGLKCTISLPENNPYKGLF